MKKLSIRGKDIRGLGYPEAPVISLAINIMEKHFKHHSIHEAQVILRNILKSPSEFVEDEILGPIAKALLPKPKEPEDGESISLNQSGIPFSIFGEEHIEQGALHQMYTAAKLPISVAGALMPDAHAGYGLPIGGVLATENAVIPYGVGVDIGCRMCLSVFGLPANDLLKQAAFFTRELLEATMFGSGAQWQQATDHEIMEREEFSELPLLKGLHARAWKQLGTSGSGNHFAEFGWVEISEADPILGLEAGTYIGLLTHSGSRALGANIARHYTELAKKLRRLPGEAANLAWLSLDEDAGHEYWMAMNLAGDYASACHHVIHAKISKQIGAKPLAMVENHHNFAWKEKWEGRDVIVHRKGATPAGKDVLGIIPGSMTAPGFIVKGKGVEASVSSASHGAGRKMSRTKALQNITQKMLNETLKKSGVTLLGAGLDEAPFAYKDIEAVMQSQRQLVDTVGKFIPKIVKMDGTPPRFGKKTVELEGE
jgi:tRNA-splicing ligase RtcB (3'-phosphate/5'-hydroxy nucleic acid ligase)